MEEVENEVHSLLEEIGHKFYLPSVRLLGFVARTAICRMYNGIYVNKTRVTQVFSLLFVHYDK